MERHLGAVLWETGTVFSLSLGPTNPPQLKIIPSEKGFVFAWPTNYAGLALQSNAALSSTGWTTISANFVVNGQNMFTNPMSGTQQFFRLSQ